LVDLLVTEVLQSRSVSLARPADGVVEPALLTRSDGSSVYTVAGSELFTSTRILQAERRLVETAGRRDGNTVSGVAVDMALLEATANGVALNAGQVAMVREMATSGARLQAGARACRCRQKLCQRPSGTYGSMMVSIPSYFAATKIAS
jgi:hypothetical protein